MTLKRNGSAAVYVGENRRPLLRRLRGPGAWAVVAAVAIAASSAAGTMVLQAGTALAPEPVVTTQDLSGPNGSTGDVVTPNSGAAGIAILWSNSAQYAPWLAVGTPCSPYALGVGQPVDWVINGAGGYRWCGVLKWYSTFVSAPWLPAGTPCAWTLLAVDQQPYQKIIAYGDYRRCD